jgi:serine protease Do
MLDRSIVSSLLAVAVLALPAAPRAWAGPGDPAPAVKPAPATPKPDADPLAAAYAVADSVDTALEKAVEAVRPCSVTVWNAKRRPGGEANAPVFDRNSGGSGVFVTWKGKGPFIISNEHVVQGADRLEVAMLDGTVREVRVKDRVQAYDIALLEFVGAPPKRLNLAKLGKCEQLKEGQWVFATGNPFFLGGDGAAVATLGVISGLNRTLKGSFTYANAIQHDTEVNPGNSGGPLWNLSGELVGINGMISSRPSEQSVGPSNTGVVRDPVPPDRGLLRRAVVGQDLGFRISASTSATARARTASRSARP